MRALGVESRLRCLLVTPAVASARWVLRLPIPCTCRLSLNMEICPLLIILVQDSQLSRAIFRYSLFVFEDLNLSNLVICMLLRASMSSVIVMLSKL